MMLKRLHFAPLVPQSWGEPELKSSRIGGFRGRDRRQVIRAYVQTHLDWGHHPKVAMFCTGEFAVMCLVCSYPINADDKAFPHYEPGISCPRCYDTLTPEKRARQEERQGIHHVKLRDS